MVIAGVLAYEAIAIETGQTLTNIGADRATFMGADGAVQTLEADSLVICQGRKPVNGLAQELSGKGMVVHTVGDARTPRSYANAIHEAAYLARQI